MARKRLLGCTFVENNRFWIDLGVPGEAIGKALGRILNKRKGNKKMKKRGEGGKVIRTLGRTSGPGKEGFWVDLDRV